MPPFSYRNGALHAEDVALAAIAEAVGTPFYCYSSAAIEQHFEAFRNAFAGQDALFFYAMKANSNQAVLTTLARLGAGMDVVSEGELRRARAAGRAGRADHLLRRWQDAGRDAARAQGKHLLLQRRIGAGARGAVARLDKRRARSRRSPSGSIPMSTRAPTPRSRPESRRTSSACRSRAPATSTPTRGPCRA